jgi:hypothetical protein
MERNAVYREGGKGLNRIKATGEKRGKNKKT